MAYINYKAYYQDQIEHIGKDFLTKKSVYKDLTDYVFHYTDPEDGLSILTDGYIYAHLMKCDMEKFGTKPFLYFTKLKPTSKSENLIKAIYDLTSLNSSSQIEKKHQTKLKKLHYAFGFKKEDLLRSKLVKFSAGSDDLWKLEDDLDLRKFKFVLVVR